MKRLHLVPLLTLVLALPLLAADYTVHELTLPGGTPDGIAMDYIAFDPHTNSVWVPAGNSGRVDVIDVATEKIAEVTGFATKEVTMRDRKRTIGPSAVSIGDGVVYIGNRGDSSICAVDEKTHQRGACATLDSMPDGVAYVAPTKEVWVTTPRDNSLRVLDAKTLAEKAKITLEGGPEGFAVDVKNGRFFTNLEDKDRTVVIDLRSRKPVATWNPACGSEGPRGLRYDSERGQLFVACTARVEVLDGTGKSVSSLDTGEGVDDMDYRDHRLYVGAAKAARLTIANVDANGKLSLVAQVATKPGARNPAAAANGTVYLAHGGGVASNAVIVVKP